MNRPDDGGGTYSSIQPAGLSAAISSLQKTIDGIGTIGGYSARFGQGGVSTAHLDKLKSFSPTISDLIPELQRRLSLAQAMIAKSGGKVAYFSSDSLGPFKTVADAKAQAVKDAKAIDDGDGLTDDALKNLQKYGTDPDYAAALLKALGPKTTFKMLYYNKDEGNDDKTTAIANFLQTATLTVPIDYKFMVDGAAAYKDKYGVLPSLALYSPYLHAGNGTWSDKQLATFADMYFDPTKYPDLAPPGLDDSTLLNLLAALKDNPTGGARYFASHQDLVYGVMRDSMNTNDDLSKAWAGYVRSATIDARNQFGTEYLDKPGDNPAILNAEYLMKKIGSDDGDDSDFPSELNTTFAAMASEYIKDYTRGVSSPLDVGSVKDPRYDGVSLSVAEWQSFLHQGMHTNEGVVLISAAFQEQIKQTLQEGGSSNLKDPTAAYWAHYATGALQRTFTNLYGDEYTRRGDEGKNMQSDIEDLIDTGIDFTLDPAGTVKDLTVDKFKDLAHQAFEAIDDKGDDDDLKLPALPGSFDTKKNYAHYAAQYLAEHPEIKKDKYGNIIGNFPGVKETIGGGTTITWDGSTHTYTEPSPPNGDFTSDKFKDEDGYVDPDKLKADPDAWRSYNEWLHDPAVQAEISKRFSQDFDGSQEGR